MKDLGLDLGFGNTKIYDNRGSTIFASHLATPGTQYASDEGNTDDTVSMVSFDGARYAVGETSFRKGSPIAGLGMHRLLGSSEVRAITYAALGNHFDNYGRVKDGLNVYVGLPANLLTAAEKASTVESVTGWLKGRHEWEQDGRTMLATVEAVTVRSQASGAISDMMFTREGVQTKEAQYLTGNFGVISIGYNTIELSGGLMGKPSDVLMGSDIFGVHRLLESCNTDGLKALPMLDLELRRGLLNGEYASIRKAWADQVFSFIDTKWKKTAKILNRVILVGGGAQYARETLENVFGARLWSPDDPYISIARGLYKRAVADGKKA